MKITPKSEEQLQKEEESKFAVWPEGKYRFQISKAEDAVSKNGADMIALILNVYNDEGESRIIKDWLLDAMAFKLRHACEACGVLDQYENGNVSPYDFEGKTGTLELKIEKGAQKKDGYGNFIPNEFYADKNSVKDYVVDKAKRPATAKAAVDELDDEMPFN